MCSINSLDSSRINEWALNARVMLVGDGGGGGEGEGGGGVLSLCMAVVVWP